MHTNKTIVSNWYLIPHCVTHDAKQKAPNDPFIGSKDRSIARHPFLRSIFRGIFLVSHLMLHLHGLILLPGERGHRINITTRMILHVH